MPTYREHLNRYRPPLSKKNREKSKLAWMTLGLGVGSWFLLPVIGAVGAVICGCIERRRIAEGTSGSGGESMVRLGMIFGGIQLGLLALSVLAAISVAVMMLPGAVWG